MPDGRHISPEALSDTLDWVLQKHVQASRGGRAHADFRFGSPEEGLESYAIPKGRLPNEKERLLAVNTAIHPYGYGSFHGRYGRGRGLNIVEILESGKLRASVSEDGTRTLEFDDASGRRYKLAKMGKGGPDDWILIGLPAVKSASDDERDIDFLPGRFVDQRTGKQICEFVVMHAITARAMRKGLGGREDLPFGLGMLFTGCNSFWMKDVPFDLDLVFLDRHFTITEILRMKGTVDDTDLPVYRGKSRNSVHAIELPAGYCEDKGIKPGDLFRVGKERK